MASRRKQPTPINGQPPAAGGRDQQQVQRAIQSAINSGEIIAVGVLHLVRTTIVTALAGVQDVGAEIGTAAVAAVRGSIKAAHSIGRRSRRRGPRVDPRNGRRRGVDRRRARRRGALSVARRGQGHRRRRRRRRDRGAARRRRHRPGRQGARGRRPHPGPERRRGRHGGGGPYRRGGQSRGASDAVRHGGRDALAGRHRRAVGPPASSAASQRQAQPGQAQPEGHHETGWVITVNRGGDRG